MNTSPTFSAAEGGHYFRFHVPHRHLSSVFGNDWFALKAEAFARFFGTPVRGGITYREAHLLMEGVAASGTLGSLEITEINPILDRENRTAILAVELILSALGKTTL